MISLVDMRPAWRRSAGAQQRRLPLWHKRLAEIIDLAKNLDDRIAHHRLRHSTPPPATPLTARKPLTRVSRPGSRWRSADGPVAPSPRPGSATAAGARASW